MCGVCGCSDGNQTTISGSHEEHVHVLADGTVIRHAHPEPGKDHTHSTHRHDHTHGPPIASDTHPRTGGSTVEQIEAQVFEKNRRLAERNRTWLSGREMFAVNLMSSPGSGKTTLLERTIREIRRPTAVLEGDQETPFDAERIRAAGAPVVQINTGQGCHLEANMVWHGLEQLAPSFGSVLFIENVGNLVCPALFDLGEAARVVLFSVTEGEDKPLKYAHMFRAADLVLLTKVDLLPHLDFDSSRAVDALRDVNPTADILSLSCRSGEGLDAWYAWLETRLTGQDHS
ncbi:MAG: hydrogenase nickel incorporation protein HypB [Myxococcota bacterium]